MKRSSKTPLILSIQRILKSTKNVEPSRREFLQNALKFAILAGVSVSSKKSFAQHLLHHHFDSDVAIVGAGMAGLHCAYQLQKSGVRARVFEGSDRVGGRIFTRHNEVMSGTYTEFGGEYVDSNHADMISLAHEFALPIIDVRKDPLYQEQFFVDGQCYAEEQVRKQLIPVQIQIDQDLKKCGQDDTEFFKALDQTPLEQYIDNLHCDTWVKRLLQFAYAAEYGLNTGDQSSLNFISMMHVETTGEFHLYGDSDERYKILGGNFQVIQGLYDKVQDQVTMNSRLMAINEKSGRYELHFDEKSDPIIAKVVVLALPFTQLRNVDMNISISDEKKNCIQNLGYGQNNKLLLGFEKRIWRTNSRRPSSGNVYDDVIQNGWDHTQIQNKNQGVGGYTIFLGGDRAKALESIEDNVSEYIQRMQKIFPGARDQYRVMKTALWTKNPWTQGSYACYKVGQWSSISGLESQPVGNIYFAGEHCSQNFQGFMNGAAESGRFAANAVLKKLNVKKPVIHQPMKSKFPDLINY